MLRLCHPFFSVSYKRANIGVAQVTSVSSSSPNYGHYVTRSALSIDHKAPQSPWSEKGKCRQGWAIHSLELNILTLPE